MFDRQLHLSYVCWEFKTQLIMKKGIIIICFVFISSVLFGQETDFKKTRRPIGAISLGFGGDGILMSVAADMRFFQGKSYYVSGRGGVGFQVFGLNQHYSLSFNYGKKVHYLEVGFGGTYAETTLLNFSIIGSSSGGGKTVEEYWFYPITGYRYHNLKTHSFFRAYINPIIDTRNLYRNQDGESLWFGKEKVAFYAGVSIGVSF